VGSTLSGRLPTGIFDLTTDPPRRRDTSALIPERSYCICDPGSRYLDEFNAGDSRTLDAENFQELATLPDVSFSTYSLDETRVVAARRSAPAFRVLDTSSWRQVSPMIDVAAWAPSQSRFNPVPGFDATGERVFASVQETGTTVVYDTATWELVQVIEPSDHGGVIAARFSRDGATLVSLGIDGTIALRDPRTWEVVRVLAGGVSATDNLDLGLHLSADGQYLLTTRDRRPRLWHLPSATVIGSFPHRTGLLATGMDLGPQLRLVTMDDEHGLIWNLDVASWPEIACRAAGRNLSQAEWAQFGPKDVPYQSTCAQWPAGPS
jgi:WD40 repeat protein